MEEHGTELEQRLSELQAQVDRLSLSLHLWRQTQDDLKPMERRLSQLTERCAELLDSWTTTGERHAHAVGALETRLVQLDATEARLEHDAAQRIGEIGRVIDHEWQSLRQIHEEPVKELREQAASLTEVCIATASTAQTGFDRAEARLAALETEFHRRMTELSREVRAAVAALRPREEGQPWALAEAAPETWPLEGVMRLHDQLRRPPEAARSLGPAGSIAQLESENGGAGPVAVGVPLLPEAAALSQRVDTLERALSDGAVQLQNVVERTERAGRSWRFVVAALVLGVAIAIGVAWRMERQAGAEAQRALGAERDAQAAKDAASQQVAQAREEASRQITAARESAQKAQTISDVLAAPDLVRYALTGGDAVNRLSGQLLWSRSRGLVFSGSRLPSPPPDTTYQIWLLSASDAVSAGAFVPDGSGRATVATSEPPRVPGPLIGVSVTTEPAGGGHSPSGPVLLARIPQPAAVQP